MKVCVNGEYFEYDLGRKMMAEMLALEEETGIPYGQWEEGLNKGSAKSLAALAWLLWHRDGRDVKFADIISGEVALNLAEFRFERDEEPPDPTGPERKTRSRSTGAATSEPSAKSA